LAELRAALFARALTRDGSRKPAAPRRQASRAPPAAFDALDLILAYTRQHAAEGGVLVGLPGTAYEAGLRYLAAQAETAYGADVEAPPGVSGEVLFPLLVRNNEGAPLGPVPVKSICGPGDDTEPFTTVISRTRVDPSDARRAADLRLTRGSRDVPLLLLIASASIRAVPPP